MSVNQAFVKAITTIKTLTKSPNSMGKPPIENKTILYGLYKQATEGDVQGIMPRPQGSTPQDQANQRKWDAWKNQQGLSKDEAKLKYIEYLLETMRQVSQDTPQSIALLNELTSIYVTAKNGFNNGGLLVAGSPIPMTQSPSPLPPPPPQHQRTWSSSSSAYGQFLRRPTYSEFGLSVGDRAERMSEVDDLPNDPGIHAPEGSPGGVIYEPSNWQSNVSWQLETISEEINSIRRRYGPNAPASEPKTPLRRSSIGSQDPPKDVSPWIKLLQKYAAYMLVYGKYMFKRIAIDMTAVVMLLILVRVVQRTPVIMQRIPLTRKLFTIFGNVIAVILREVGFDIKQRPYLKGEH